MFKLTGDDGKVSDVPARYTFVYQNTFLLCKVVELSFHPFCARWLKNAAAPLGLFAQLGKSAQMMRLKRRDVAACVDAAWGCDECSRGR